MKEQSAGSVRASERSAALKGWISSLHIDRLSISLQAFLLFCQRSVIFFFPHPFPCWKSSLACPISTHVEGTGSDLWLQKWCRLQNEDQQLPETWAWRCHSQREWEKSVSSVKWAYIGWERGVSKPPWLPKLCCLFFLHLSLLKKSLAVHSTLTFPCNNKKTTPSQRPHFLFRNSSPATAAHLD